MWYVLDKTYDIVIAALPTRAEAYRVRQNHKSIYPLSNVKVVRTLV